MEATPATNLAREEKRLNRRITLKQRAFDLSAIVLLIAQIATLLCVLFAAVPAIQIVFQKYSYSTVLTGSMTGSINQGDIVIMKQYHGETLTEGTVIGINNPSGSPFIHRIVAVNEDGTYTTQGDANDRPDLFKPHGGKDSEDIWGVLEAVHGQPLATAITFFAPDKQWTDEFVGALSGGDFLGAVGMLSSAPKGYVGLIAAFFLSWWLVPDFLTWLHKRSEARNEKARRELETASGRSTAPAPSSDDLDELPDSDEQTPAETTTGDREEASAEEQPLPALLNLDADEFKNQLAATARADRKEK